MSRWFIKMFPAVLHDSRFKELSARARYVWCILNMVAGEVDRDGRLEVKGVRPMVASDFVPFCALSVSRVQTALDELCRIPTFLVRESDGTYVIDKWHEKQAKKAQNAARVGNWRDRQRNDSVTQEALPGVTETPLPKNNIGNASKSKSSTLSLSTDSDTGASAPQAPPWQETLRWNARKLKSKTIAVLSPDDRKVLAQYHCLEFGNCTRSESRNLKMSTMVAAKLATLGRRKFFEGLTVGQYVAYARSVHQQREFAPWFDPHLIESVVETA